MVPRIRFHGQPWESDDTAGEFLRGTLADPAIQNLTVVVAWARFRGLARLRDELVAFRDRATSRINKPTVCHSSEFMEESRHTPMSSIAAADVSGELQRDRSA